MGNLSKHRDCPVVGRTITAGECASGRHSHYACPEQCSFNPFSAAHYAQFLAMEGGADEKFMKWFSQNVPNRAQVNATMQRLLKDKPNLDFYTYLAWTGFLKTDANGETFLGQWAKAGYPGLKNDEKVLMHARAQMRVAALEVQQVIDHCRIQAVDLLDPQRQPFIVMDQALARIAVRFGVYLGYLTQLPHFCRLFGACLIVPALDPFEPVEVLNEIIQHLGGPTDPVGRQRWLTEHAARLEDAYLAVNQARRRASLERLDACFGIAVYELHAAFAECRARLDSIPEVADEDLSGQERKEGFGEARAWFAKPEQYTTQLPNSVRGRILLGAKQWRMEVMGGERLDRLRQEFEELMGERVRFIAERRDDVGARMLMNEPHYDPRLVPPRLLTQPRQLSFQSSRVAVPPTMSQSQWKAAQLRLMDARFLDEAVPALNGKTPREAAADPNLRLPLIHLMKARIRSQDERNLETGSDYDLSWMLAELGLQEILYSPPPPRKPLPRTPGDDLAPTGRTMDNLPTPPLPAQPWSNAEAGKLYVEAVAAFPQEQQAVEYLDELGYSLIDDLYDLCGNMIEDWEFEWLEPILAAVVLSFAPAGTRPPEPEIETLRETFAQVVAELRQSKDNQFSRTVEHWINTSRQPGILKCALTDLAARSEHTPKKKRPRDISKITMIVILKVVVDQLDQAMRQC